MSDEKISTIVESQFPSFLKDEGTRLISFIKAYYEWLEQNENVYNEAKNLLEYFDIDSTNDDYITYFMDEIADSFPQDVLTDKKLLAKNIKDYYLSKGSTKAYQLLFRILYDDDIEIFFPGEFILRASDGRWVQEKSLRTSLRVTEGESGDPEDFDGQRIIGGTSGATAEVEKIVTRLESGVEIFELFITDLVGDFADNETISTIDGSISAVIISAIGPIESVEVSFGGTGHRVGDTVDFISSEGSGANGNITNVNSTGILFTIVDGGSGYTTDAAITLGPSSGEGAAFVISSISNTETITVYDDEISAVSNVEIGAATFSVGNTGVISSNLASSNSGDTIGSSLGTSNGIYGTINSISVTATGEGYDLLLPTVTIRQDEVADLEISDGSGGIKGLNANIDVSFAPGAMREVSVNIPGQGYKAESLTIVNLSNTSAVDGTGIPSITGVIEYPGKYIDTKGWLSWNNVLQDNFYYQEYSYEIKSKEYLNQYRNIVERAAHPVGTALFGKVEVTDSLAINSSSLFAQTELTIS